MANSSNEMGPIRGSCLSMCPREEIRMRQRERLCHVLECPKNPKGQRVEFADHRLMVKEYRRSGAGKEIEASNIRPLVVLKKTVNYLIASVCTVEDVSWREVYDFVSDRLRAVLQDVTVQAPPPKDVIPLLVPIARFYVYAQYRLCELDISEFDPFLNLKQLNNVLLTLLDAFKEVQYSADLPLVDFEKKLRENDKNDHSNPNDGEEDSAVSLSHKSCQKDDSTYRQDYDSSSNDDIHNSQLNDNERVTNDLQDGISSISNNVGYNEDGSSDLNSGEQVERIQNLDAYTNIRCPDVSWNDDNIQSDFQLSENNFTENPDCESDGYGCESTEIIDLAQNLCAIHIDGADRTSLYKYSVIEEMVSCFVLIHIGDPEVIALVLSMPKSVRKSSLLNAVTRASLNWTMGNHLSLIRMSGRLSPILAMALHLHLNKIQRFALGVLSVAHNGKVSEYCASDLRKYLLFSSDESVLKVCQYYGLSTSDKGVTFQKSSYKWDMEPMKPEKSELIEDKMKCFTIPELLLAQSNDR